MEYEGYNYAGNDSTYGGASTNGYYERDTYGGADVNAQVAGYTGTGGPGTPSKITEPKSMIPIVVSMINKSIQQQDGMFSLFDVKVTNVCICGLVSSYSASVNGSKDYVIHDSTGSITGKYYAGAQDQEEIVSGYVKIIGSLKTYRDRVTLSIHNILPILNLDKITDHYLTVISCFLYYKQRSGSSSQSVTKAIVEQMNTGVQNAVGYGTDMSDVESKIYNLLQMNRSNGGDGIHIQEITSALLIQGVNREEVSFHVDQMVQNMTIFESNPQMYTVQ